MSPTTASTAVHSMGLPTANSSEPAAHVDRPVIEGGESADQEDS